ncbi:MAG: NUDIX hydrolase N-terminal domain-containing protein [Chloroflexota bacterium]|nr:NUDIX hydrolase N-terminal domain-containing protein [Chloroflexota bacterium]
MESKDTQPGIHVDTGRAVVEIADELRAIATNGLLWAANEYDTARYEKAMQLAARLLSLADTRGEVEIERIFRGDLGIRTPFVGADAAIFNETGAILLIQRGDNGMWAMPGGAADVGESPSHVAVREAWEETGLRVRPVALVGVYDSRLVGSPDAGHLYHLVFLCEMQSGELTLTNETTAFGYFTEEAALRLPLHRGHAARILDAFRAFKGEVGGSLFQ